MSKPIFFDTHAHLDFPDFDSDRVEVVARAEAAGIDRIITIGTTLETSRKAVKIAEKSPRVYAAVGWHPSHVTEAPMELPAELGEFASHPKVVAIGETGLDYSRLPSGTGGSAEDDHHYKQRQGALFRQQLDLAAELGLNVIVHQRECFAETLAAWRPFAAKVRAVFHCFVGTPDEQKAVAELNGLVSFTGIATFKNATVVRETLRGTPLGGFMLETDCPFLAPVPYRGKRCEPAYVADLAAFVTREKSCSLEELSAATCETARRFFPKLAD